MNTLPEERAAYVALLEPTGLKVYDHVPEQLQAPCVVIEPAEPWLKSGEADIPFGQYKATWLLTVVADIGTNEKATTGLDGHVTNVLGKVNAENVSAPVEFIYNTAKYLAAVVTVSDLITP